jgi:hypothetical protein
MEDFQGSIHAPDIGWKPFIKVTLGTRVTFFLISPRRRDNKGIDRERSKDRDTDGFQKKLDFAMIHALNFS